ncbi:MAG: tRNA pseudouridine(13) synthase TruD [Nanoarchaeota archaeon]|nr:tRNA pseudouridine(13) synthase TruD [Nanoarchaeota archaeon]MBU4242060.1 tRNA pseudouridine(13) synthase TruD [Nanoarchaeota archaeon]MBU4351911.1 tRNA pseudouridine(13) synthase TruD [Nanoarchaeota archaeon]MBU4456792.1 tRNA pseudouridine(13) synthase TruD [Nanoarchaeota archaeon]MCG2719350.1 tRNA pseudouridine(13) synthase TruD [Nanoarchaeota archaeon]
MKIKQIPEDFVVKEIANIKLDGGSFAYFKLKKKLWNTIDAVNEIAKVLNVNFNRLRYAGIKDRQAVTEQFISAENVSKEALEKAKVKDIEIEYLGQSSERMHTGLLIGNEFIITIRDIDEQLEAVKFIPNYFDDQRFGLNSNNHLVGKALLQKDFKKACELMELEVFNNDYINALKRKKAVLKLCFNAYQSYLFNEALKVYIQKNSEFKEAEYNLGKLAFPKNKIENFTLPLLQFDTELEENIKEIYEEILSKEKITKRDFIIRQFPDLLQITQDRKAFIEVEDFETIEFSDDELNEDKKKQIVRFKLPKGSYATIAIKALAINLNS